MNVLLHLWKSSRTTVRVLFDLGIPRDAASCGRFSNYDALIYYGTNFFIMKKWWLDHQKLVNIKKYFPVHKINSFEIWVPIGQILRTKENIGKKVINTRIAARTTVPECKRDDTRIAEYPKPDLYVENCLMDWFQAKKENLLIGYRIWFVLKPFFNLYVQPLSL